MPKPVYILCSESGSEDRTTSLLSHFKVLEHIEARELPRPPAGHPVAISSLSFQIVAVWEKTAEDAEGEEYESVTSICLPPENNEIIVATGKFDFPGSKRRYRSIVNVSGVVISSPGTLRVRDKIRACRGTNQEWLVQAYDVSVDYVPSSAPSAS